VETKGRSQEAFSHPQFRRDDKDLSLSLGRNKVGDRRRKRPASSTITTPTTSTTPDMAVSSSSAMPFFAGMTSQQQDVPLPLRFSSSSISTQQFSGLLTTVASSHMFQKQQQQQHLTEQDTTTPCNTWDATMGGSRPWEPQSRELPHYHQQHEQQQQQQLRLFSDPLSHRLCSLPQRHGTPPDKQRQLLQQILPSPHQLQQPPSMLQLPQYSQDDMSPTVSTRLFLQHSHPQQDDFSPIPIIMDAETTFMSHMNDPSSMYARQDVSLRTGMQQHQLTGEDCTSNALRSESKMSSQPSSLPPLPLSSFPSLYDQVKWGTTTAAPAINCTGTTTGGSDFKRPKQQHGQDGPRWKVLEPRSIEEMIARPLQRHQQHQYQNDDDEDIDEER
jgi:hypothetical protein